MGGLSKDFIQINQGQGIVVALIVDVISVIFCIFCYFFVLLFCFSDVV